MEDSIEVYPGITMDSAIRFGKPCITGTRIDVATVLGRFAAGDKIEEIQEDYQLTRAQVMAALAYATHVAEHLPPAVKSAWLSCSMRRTAVLNPRRRLRGRCARLQGEHHLVACCAIYGDRSTSRNLAKRREPIPFQEVGWEILRAVWRWEASSRGSYKEIDLVDYSCLSSAAAEKKASVMRALAARDVTDNIGDEVWSLNVEPLNLEPPQGFKRLELLEPGLKITLNSWTLNLEVPLGLTFELPWGFERSEAIEHLERLEQAQAKIVLRFMKNSRATISSVDQMINNSSLVPARDSWHGRGLSHRGLRSQREKVACPLYSPTSAFRKNHLLRMAFGATVDSSGYESFSLDAQGICNVVSSCWPRLNLSEPVNRSVLRTQLSR
jgi:uncharacterized protein (DUF433 family)